MNIIQTIVLSIIEGITEFLPISSTGHMILASSIMNISEDAFVKTFEIAIQIGAIMAIALMYAKRFLQGITIYIKLAVAFIPTGILGIFAYHYIKAYLFNPIVVSISLILGGIVLILIDKKMVSQQSKTDVLENISYKNAFFIGLFQSVSMIPGVSRAAATIIGGIFNGLDKKQALEFSFLLAVPTMVVATGYDLYKTPVVFTGHEVFLVCLGLVIAFITAWIAVKVFINLVQNYGFKYFGYYRIILGIIFLLFVKF
ncbi:MAG TPA: undecaprenyl-diphosphatase UppP [Bacteroidales bacterium]|nr:undecaprenyl-diphosphatase UppP [Bacteroidales bacterium]